MIQELMIDPPRAEQHSSSSLSQSEALTFNYPNYHSSLFLIWFICRKAGWLLHERVPVSFAIGKPCEVLKSKILTFNYSPPTGGSSCFRCCFHFKGSVQLFDTRI